jgi:hypothetical protein
MFKFLRIFLTVALFLIMALIPLLGNCQIAVPSWVDGIGGVGSSSIPADVRTDQQNNVYITGLYSGTVDFDPSAAGVFNLTSVNGSFDIYVAKYTSAGKLIWAVSMGGSGTDQVNAMTIDGNGNPTISGQYDSPVLDADPGPGVFNLTNNGDKDAFIIKLNTDGTFSWAKSIGGSQTDYGGKVVADSQGNIIEVTQFQSTIKVGNNTYTSQGAFNDLIVKYNSAGALLWSIDIGDTNNSEPHSCAVDHSDNVIVSGSFSSNDNFNPLGTASFLNGNGSSTYIAKYTPVGNLIWVTSIAGSLVNSNSNLCVNSKNEIYIDGPFSSTLVFSGIKTLNPTGIQDIFVAKLSSNGVFQSVNDIGGGNASIYNYGLVADQVDNIYLSGYFSGTVDFNPSPTATAFVSDHGQRDMFLSKFDGNLNYKWAFSGGNASCNNTLARNVTVDNNNDVLLTGSFCSTVNFDASKCTSYNLTAQSNIRDSFLAKYVQSKATANSQITAFSVLQQVSPAVIDQTNLQITITVPTGTDVFALKPAITASTGATVVPASGTAQNFTSPVIYTLNTACNTLNYTVNVVFLNTAKPVTTCSGASNIIIGDIENPVPTSYTWQLLQNNVWVNAPGVINNRDYQTSSLINKTNANVIFSLRRQILISGNVSSDSFYTITVQPVIAILNNLITPPSVTSFCSGGIPGTIVGSTPSGGNGTYTYQWQSSANNVTFTDVAGATIKDINPVLVNATTYFRRTVTSGNCVAPLVSNVVTVTVIPAITNNTVTAPAVTVFCSGGDPAIIVGSVPLGGNGTYTYQWQSSADNVTFTNIAAAASKDFNPPFINVTAYYRRTVISGVCITPLVTNVIPINITIIPATPVPVASVISVCAGNAATLSIATLYKE